MAKHHEAALLSPAALATTDVEILDTAAEPINALEKALGGRKNLVQSLAIEATPEMRNLVEMLVDPRFDGRSLGWLAAKVQIGLTDLLRAYRSGVLATAHIIATQRVADKLPAVVEDVMKRAVPYEEDCAGCDATGQMTVRPTKKVPIPDPAQVPCTICRGKGKVLRLPELDRQRLALELGELIKGNRAPTFMQQINLPAAGQNAGDASAGSLERMQQAVTNLLYRQPPVIDAEPIEPTTSDPTP